MDTAPARWTGEEGAVRRLAEMGLDEGVLHAALSRGEVERRTCTANDPSYLPGILAQARTIRALREALALEGWVRDDIRGLPLVVDPANSRAIAVATGDEGTGHPSKPASTKHAKGPATAGLVASNQLQLAIVGAPEPYSPDYTTWVLLFRRAGREIKSELSLPQTITQGKIVEWSERIILSSLSLDSGDVPVMPTPEPEADSEVIVRPRTAS